MRYVPGWVELRYKTEIVTEIVTEMLTDVLTGTSTNGVTNGGVNGGVNGSANQKRRCQQRPTTDRETCRDKPSNYEAVENGTCMSNLLCQRYPR